MAIPRCPQSGKVSYQYRIIAEQRAQHWKRMDGNKQYPYQCSHCKYWHLSSMSKEEFAKSTAIKN